MNFLGPDPLRCRPILRPNKFHPAQAGPSCCFFSFIEYYVSFPHKTPQWPLLNFEIECNKETPNEALSLSQTSRVHYYSRHPAMCLVRIRSEIPRHQTAMWSVLMVGRLDVDKLIINGHALRVKGRREITNERPSFETFLICRVGASERGGISWPLWEISPEFGNYSPISWGGGEDPLFIG